MATVKRFEDLECWQEARKFVQLIYKLTKEKRFSTETVSHCYVALDQEYINKEAMDQVNKQADVVWKKVNSFIKYLNKHV